MGKREGLSNTQKRQIHDVYVKDKQDQKYLTSTSALKFVVRFFHSFSAARLAWFIHENVEHYPPQHIEKPFSEKTGYGMQSSKISPERFGKPMQRQMVFDQVSNPRNAFIIL